MASVCWNRLLGWSDFLFVLSFCWARWHVSVLGLCVVAEGNPDWNRGRNVGVGVDFVNEGLIVKLLTVKIFDESERRKTTDNSKVFHCDWNDIDDICFFLRSEGDRWRLVLPKPLISCSEFVAVSLPAFQ